MGRGRLGGAEHQRDVVAAESERVVDRRELTLGGQGARRVANEVDLEFGVRLRDVDGGRRGPILQRLDGEHGLESTGDPIMNLPWTHCGLPSVNLPSGYEEDGLPVGLQAVGKWYEDEALLEWSAQLEMTLRNGSEN